MRSYPLLPLLLLSGVAAACSSSTSSSTAPGGPDGADASAAGVTPDGGGVDAVPSADGAASDGRSPLPDGAPGPGDAAPDAAPPNAGDRDPTFGDHGVADPKISGYLFASALAADDKILMVGTNVDANFQVGYLVARLRADGSLDPSFGTGGVATTPSISPTAPSRMRVALQPDGNILVVGDLHGGAAIARFDTTGHMDAAFGANGIAAPSFPDGWPLGLAVTANGGIVVYVMREPVTGNSYSYARLNPAGGVDTSFGTNGSVTIAGIASNALDGALLVQPDGKLLSANGVTVRLLAGGAVDTAFGTGGQTSLGLFTPADATLQPDGAIAMAGAYQAQFAVSRLSAAGQSDASFAGANGRAIVPTTGTSEARGLVLQPDGKIVVAGCERLGAPGTAFVVARLSASGAMDSSFGAGGAVSVDLGDGECANGVLRQSDGKLVVLGSGFKAFRLWN